MKRVLLTGAAGFIGRHCSSRLRQRGYTVHALSTSREGARDGVQWHRCDLLDPYQTARVAEAVGASHLLHLAWYTEHGKFWSAPENIAWARASLGLFEEFARHGGRRAVVAGTCAEYDWSCGFLSEGTTPLAPSSQYGRCKRALGELFEAWAETSGVSGAWGRVFLLFGPHQPERALIPSVVRSLLRGERAACSHGQQVRDFLYVEDVADALVALLDSKVVGAVNIASGRPLAVKELIEMAASRLGGTELLDLGALPAPEGDPPFLVGDLKRLQGELGWRPPIGIEEGLDRTIAWTREQLGAEKVASK